MGGEEHMVFEDTFSENNLFNRHNSSSFPIYLSQCMSFIELTHGLYLTKYKKKKNILRVKMLSRLSMKLCCGETLGTNALSYKVPLLEHCKIPIY